MNKTVKIMHIDPDFRVTYFINHDGVLISSPLSLEQAISLLKTEKLDLILSEPHQKAILDTQDHPNKMDFNFSDDQFLKKEDSRYGQNEKSLPPTAKPA
ncbi:MAG: hypothetical protein HY787_05080 [Deltaproteobacteria bacterium]|nr:hypothetical protein [Deltaproteobacteria bacterium]